MIGRAYLERGEPVIVECRWAHTRWDGELSCPLCGLLAVAVREPGEKLYPAVWHYCPVQRGPRFLARRRVGGPRNVLIRRGDGSRVVRPFRGLKRRPHG